MRERPQFLAVAHDGETTPIAWRASDERAPTVVWLGGFRSDMRSTKAEALAAWGEATGQRVLRFDYSGHGESGGRFEDGTIGRWRQDAEAVLDALVPEPAVLVGSSMGGWLALLIARDRRLAQPPRPIAGLVLIAPAVDFTETLMWDRFPEPIRRQVLEEGVWHRPSAYGPEPYPITRGLIAEGRRHLLYGAPFRVGCPVHILQGLRDPDVPAEHALRLVEHLPEDEVTTTLIADGEHRLSRPEDIAQLLAAVERMTGAQPADVSGG